MNRYFIFGDVHGKFLPLISALQDAGWDEKNPNHVLISLGDNFDRGPKNVEIYKFLRRHNTLCIMGNHELFFYQYLLGLDNGLWNCEVNGMWWTLRDFSGRDIPATDYSHLLPHLRYQIQERFLDLTSWLGTMPDGYKIGDYILTHAGFATNYPTHESDKSWYPCNAAKTPDFIKKYDGHTGKFRFIFGHWHAWRLTKEFIGIEDVKSCIFDYGNFIGLDACTNLTYRVNIYVIDSDKEAIPFTKRNTLEEIKKM